MMVGLSCRLWLERCTDAGFLQGVRAGGENKTDLPGRTMSVFYGTQKQLHQLDAVALCESGLGTQVWAHVV